MLRALRSSIRALDEKNKAKLNSQFCTRDIVDVLKKMGSPGGAKNRTWTTCSRSTYTPVILRRLMSDRRHIDLVRWSLSCEWIGKENPLRKFLGGS